MASNGESGKVGQANTDQQPAGGGTTSWVVGTTVGIGGAIVIARLIWNHGKGRRAITWAMRGVGAASILAVFFLTVTVDTPWVSKERIETADGTIDGWVLETRAGFLKILTEDRTFEIRASSKVVSRTVIDG